MVSPPDSWSKAWVPGQILGSAGPQSYYMKTSTRQIRQLQLAPPLNNVEPLPETNTNSNLPDKLGSYSLTLHHHLLHLPLPQQHPVTSVNLLCHRQFAAQLHGHRPNQPLTPQYHPVFTALQFQMLLSHPVNLFLKSLPIVVYLFENLFATLTDYQLVGLPKQVANTSAAVSTERMPTVELLHLAVQLYRSIERMPTVELLQVTVQLKAT